MERALLLFLLASLVTPSVGQNGKNVEIGRVSITANSQQREGSLFRCRGDVEMAAHSFVLRADEVSYHEDTGTAEARGNVRVQLLSMNSAGLNNAAPLLRRIVVKHHGFDDAALNDATMSELEAYEAKYRQDLPKVETGYDQKDADALKSVLEKFWEERGFTVDVYTNLKPVPNALRYAILEFDVYKR